MLGLLLGCLLGPLFALQEVQVDRHIDALGTPEALSAASTLVELGAGKQLKARLDTLPTEAQFYARMALDELALKAALGKKWKAAKRYSFSWQEIPFEEAANELADAAEIDLSFNNQMGGVFGAEAVTLELKDVMLVKALVELALKGGVRLNGSGKYWTFISGGPAPRGLFAWRRTIFTIGNLTRQRRVTFTGPPTSRISIYITVNSDPVLPALCSRDYTLKILEATDQDGKSLIPPEREKPKDGDYSDPDKPPKAAANLAICRPGNVNLSVELINPGNEKTLKRLRGTVAQDLPLKFSDLVIKNLDEPDKAGGTVGPYTAKVDSIQSRWGRVTVKFLVTRTDGTALKETLPHFHFTGEAEDAEAPLLVWGNAHRDNDKTLTYNMTFYQNYQGGVMVEETAPPDSVTIRLVAERTRVRSSFEFHDLELDP